MVTLHPQLLADTTHVGDLPLCRVLLMNNALYPWLILVPKRDNLVEIIDLPSVDRRVLMDEIARASQILKDVYKPDKINVAALGNQVSQLHIHVIARFKKDAAWPNPVWGQGSQAYVPEELVKTAETLTAKIRTWAR